jgi:hypothetical protein
MVAQQGFAIGRPMALGQKENNIVILTQVKWSGLMEDIMDIYLVWPVLSMGGLMRLNLNIWQWLWFKVWLICEYFNFDLGRIASWIFAQMMGCSKYKKIKEK